ncbi:hypothetical protein [Mycolicibacterium rutilum]|nr:hypothetical protein [Mycolicibacterium rutilum]
MTNPVEEWARVIETSLSNVNTVGQRWLADPAPLLRQVLANQLGMATNLPAVAQALVARLGQMNPADPNSVPAMFEQFIVNQLESVGILADALQSVVDQLGAVMDPADPFGVPATVRQMIDQFASGEFAQGVTTFASLGVLIGLPVIMAGFPIAGVLSQPFKDLANIIDPTGVASQPLRNIANFIDRVPSVLPSVLLNGILGPLNSAGVATAASLEDIVDAVMGADPISLVSALLNAPAKITDAFLNGIMAPGDFPMAGLIGGPFGISAVGAVMDAIKSLAQAIASPTTSARQSTSAPDTALVSDSPLKSEPDLTVTVDVVAEAEEEPTADAAPAPVAQEPAAEPVVAEVSTPEVDEGDAEPNLVRVSLKAEPGETGMGTTQPGDEDPVDDETAGDFATTPGAVITPADGSDAPAGQAGESDSQTSTSDGPAGGAGDGEA